MTELLFQVDKLRMSSEQCNLSMQSRIDMLDTKLKACEGMICDYSRFKLEACLTSVRPFSLLHCKGKLKPVHCCAKPECLLMEEFLLLMDTVPVILLEVRTRPSCRLSKIKCCYARSTLSSNAILPCPSCLAAAPRNETLPCLRSLVDSHVCCYKQDNSINHSQ